MDALLANEPMIRLGAFGTYRDQPVAGHAAMSIGIGQLRAPRELWLHRMLTQPLRDDRPAHRARPRPGAAA